MVTGIWVRFQPVTHHPLSIFQLREILSKLSAKESGIDVLVDVRLWRVSGCHEFLASLGAYKCHMYLSFLTYF